MVAARSGICSTAAGLVAAALLSGVGTGLMTPAVNASVGDLITMDGRDADGGPALASFQAVGDIGAFVGPVLADADPGCARPSSVPVRRPARTLTRPITPNTPPSRLSASHAGGAGSPCTVAVACGPIGTSGSTEV
jgi:hypothetical protein